MRGYEINMRRERHSPYEFLAVIPEAYRNRHGDRYYMALTETDGWVELDPHYVTTRTRTSTVYPTSLKRAVDRRLGYILTPVARLSSR